MHLITILAGLISPAFAESACDSGCPGGTYWSVGPQFYGQILPTNARLLVYGVASPTVTDGAGAAVEVTISGGPEGALWVAPVGAWAAGQTYTLVLDAGATQPFTIGAGPDEAAPTATGLTTETWGFSTCNETMAVLSVSAEGLTDDQTAVADLTAELRVTGAPDADARVLGAEDLYDLTVEDGDDCMDALPGVENGDTITLDLRFYDLAGNASAVVSTEPVTMYVEDPDHGWLDDEVKDTPCGCATGPVGAEGLVLLLAGLTRRRLRPAPPAQGAR